MLIFPEGIRLAASNLVCCLHLPKPVIKTPKGKSKRSLGLVELPFFRFPFIISATAEASDFKFDLLLAFVKANHKKNTQTKKGVWPRARGAPKIMGSSLSLLLLIKLATSDLVCSLCSPRSIMKHTQRKKWAYSLS